MNELAFAYLHGYASGPRSKKGTALATALLTEGLSLELPDLNRPSLQNLTLAGMLEAVDALVAGHSDTRRWAFVGSSLGGWVAARWAELHPERTTRLVLLCPALGVLRHMPALVKDAADHPATPAVPCPTLIIHGVRDAVIPHTTSRAYADAHPCVRLVTVDDDHDLVASLPLIVSETLAFFTS